MSDVGAKIQTLTKTIVIIGLIACVICFIGSVITYNENKSYLKYATAYGGSGGYGSLQEAGDRAYNALQLRRSSLTWALSIAVFALPLYGFGVLVEETENQTLRLSKIEYYLSKIEDHTSVEEQKREK